MLSWFRRGSPDICAGISPQVYADNHLFTQVIESTHLDNALRWLREQSVGQDHSDVWDYSRDWEQHKAALQQQVRSGTFRFQPVHEVDITDDKGDTSRREIRPAQDRILIRAIAQVLKPVFGEALSRDCVHLAGNGGGKAAVAQLQGYIDQHPEAEIIKSDVKGYYAHIDHTLLHEQLHHLLPNEPELNRILWQFMRRTVELGGHYREVECGLPLGASLSPLLGALYLRPLDELAKSTPDSFYRRYMDGWAWVLPKKTRLRKALKQQYAVLQALRVAMHPDKTFIGKVVKGFDFLGFHITPTGVTVSAAALSRHEQKVARLYEQGASPKRIRAYRLRWLAWVGAMNSFLLCANIANSAPTTPPKVYPSCPLTTVDTDLGNGNIVRSYTIAKPYLVNNAPLLSTMNFIANTSALRGSALYNTASVFTFESYSSTPPSALAAWPTTVSAETAPSSGTETRYLTMGGNDDGYCTYRYSLTVDPASTSGKYSRSNFTVYTPIAPDSDATVTAGDGVNEPVNLSTTANAVASAVNVFDFKISDGGGADGLSTDVTQIKLNTSGTGDFSKVTWRLNGAGASNVSGDYDNNAKTITFSGLTLSVADGGTATYTVNAYFNNITGIVDNSTYILSVNGKDDLTLDSSKTQMSAANTDVTNGTGTKATVTATEPSSALKPGDIAFVGFNADDNDEFAFVALSDIPAGAKIFFTDNGWDGGKFTVAEGTLAWTAPAGGISAGRVVTVAGKTPSVDVGTINEDKADFNLGTSGDQLFAYQASAYNTAPTAFLAALTSKGTGGDLNLASTGLTLGSTAIDFAAIKGDANDGGYYNAPRNDKPAFSDYLAVINDANNWGVEADDGSLAVPKFAGAFSLWTDTAAAPLVLSPILAPLKPELGTQTLNFTLSNPAGNPAITLGNPAITSAHTAEFTPDASACGTPLAAGVSCTLSVTYTPDSANVGVRTALLSVPNTSGTVLATALLTSNEGTTSQAARRLPDALTELAFTQNGSPVTRLQSGVATTVSWGQTGYQAGMESVLAAFECDQTTLNSGNCGSSYSTKTQDSGFQSAQENLGASWSFQGVSAKLNRYQWTFTPQCQGDALVMRFYQRSTQDKAADNNSLSLLIPGGLLPPAAYYDHEGRRLTLPCTH